MLYNFDKKNFHLKIDTNWDRVKKPFSKLLSSLGCEEAAGACVFIRVRSSTIVPNFNYDAVILFLNFAKGKKE